MEGSIDEWDFEALNEAMESCRGMEIGPEEMAALAAEVEALAAVPIGEFMGEFSDALKYGKEGRE